MAGYRGYGENRGAVRGNRGLKVPWKTDRVFYQKSLELNPRPRGPVKKAVHTPLSGGPFSRCFDGTFDGLTSAHVDRVFDAQYDSYDRDRKIPPGLFKPKLCHLPRKRISQRLMRHSSRPIVRQFAIAKSRRNSSSEKAAANAQEFFHT